MDKITLPGGGWAQLRDPDAVTERQRKPFMEMAGRASKIEGMDDGGIVALIAVQDALIMAMVESWSYDSPVAIDSLLDLPHKAVTALRKECMRFQGDLMPDFSPSKDPESPTTPSSD